MSSIWQALGYICGAGLALVMFKFLEHLVWKWFANRDFNRRAQLAVEEFDRNNPGNPDHGKPWVRR